MRYVYNSQIKKVIAEFESEKDALDFIGLQVNLSNNSAYQLTKYWGYPKGRAGIRQIERDLGRSSMVEVLIS